MRFLSRRDKNSFLIGNTHLHPWIPKMLICEVLSAEWGGERFKKKKSPKVKEVEKIHPAQTMFLKSIMTTYFSIKYPRKHATLTKWQQKQQKSGELKTVFQNWLEDPKYILHVGPWNRGWESHTPSRGWFVSSRWVSSGTFSSHSLQRRLWFCLLPKGLKCLT